MGGFPDNSKELELLFLDSRGFFRLLLLQHTIDNVSHSSESPDMLCKGFFLLLLLQLRNGILSPLIRAFSRALWYPASACLMTPMPGSLSRTLASFSCAS